MPQQLRHAVPDVFALGGEEIDVIGQVLAGFFAGFVFPAADAFAFEQVNPISDHGVGGAGFIFQRQEDAAGGGDRSYGLPRRSRGRDLGRRGRPLRPSVPASRDAPARQGSKRHQSRSLEPNSLSVQQNPAEQRAC